MATKSPPFSNYPEWTTSRFFSFIRSALRSASIRWPPKLNSKQKAKRKYEGPNKRQKFEYQCAYCQNWFPDKEIELDHIVEVGTLKTFEDLPGFVERMFCNEEGFQVLCKPCHLQKRKKEGT